jgi:hypothetical protein
MARRKLYQLLLALCVVSIFLFEQTPAQDYRGRIQGVVKDSTGGVIPGAEITLVSVGTGVKTTRTTSDVGFYLFDFLEPGSYTLSVEMPGFRRLVQENVDVRTRGDVTVDAVLPPGEISDAVTVSASPAAVRFNTTSVTHTLNDVLARELPHFSRNPFRTIMTNPGITNTRPQNMNPWESWSANAFDVGGGTGLANEIQVDGSPAAIAYKAAYTPAPGAVAEVSVMQNAVSAEYGYTAGGVLTVVTKTGTNEWHGDLSYTHRSPSFNALRDRMNPIAGKDITRYHIGQGNIGHPIIKNKLFHFMNYEQWQVTVPYGWAGRLPTSLEKQGDFSQTFGLVGGQSFVKPIYDPLSTTYDPVTGAVQRTAFPNNRIPAERMDPLGKRILQSIWSPNNPGDNITGVNNFRGTYNNDTSYRNVSNRVDWHVNDNWKLYGRVSLFRTKKQNFAQDAAWQSSEVWVPSGGFQHAFNTAGDAVWTLDAATVVNIHFDYSNFQDDYASPDKMLKDGWAGIWPDNPWYAPHDVGLMLSEFPRISLNGGDRFGRSSWYWYQHASSQSLKGSLAKQKGRHYLKTGFEQRRKWTDGLVVETTRFNFTSAMTADTFVNPDTRYRGDEYASLLLGFIDPGGSAARYSPLKQPIGNYYGLYFQDDLKVSSRLSLNLGLRWEYYPAWGEKQDRLSRYLDLDHVIPGMDAVAAKFPAQALALRNANEPLRLTGGWLFTDAQNPNPWNAPKVNLAPKIGGGYRLDDKTVVRVGFARFLLPDSADSTQLNFLQPPMPGYDLTQYPEPLLLGVPRATLSDPFPAATNPLLGPKGKDFGTSLGLGGGGLEWIYQDVRLGANDRVNFTVQRQLPTDLLLEVTYLMNFNRNQPIMRNINLTDPRLSYQHQGLLNQTVDNPFYGFGTAETFPGSLRTQSKVTLGSLLAPYPQYGAMTVKYYPSGGLGRYRALQFRLDRPFKSGYTFTFGYNYNRSKNESFYDSVDTYLENYTWLEALDPRHRANFTGVVDAPFGRNRRLLSAMHPILDGILGGWRVTGSLWSQSGQHLNLGQGLVVAGNPALEKSERTRERWFDTSLVSRLPAYTRPSNPAYWPGLTGPWAWNLDANMSKNFRVTEGLTLQARAVAYNVLNRLQYGNPNLNFNDSANFGSAVRSRANVGRVMEIELRILF